MKKITYDENSDRIELHTHYVDKEKAASLPGRRWRPTNKTWSVPATPAIWERVKEIWPDDAQRAAESDEAIEAVQHALEQRKCADAAARNCSCSDYDYHTEPWEHQVGATAWALRMDRALLHCRMGAGKTKITLDVARNKGYDQILVVCPRAVIQVWGQELDTHAPGEWRFLPLEGGGSTTVEDRAQALRQILATRRPFLAAINYEATWREPIASLLKAPEHLDRWPLLVLDESHRVKSPSAKQARFAAKIPAGQILALTGTPMPHSPLDLYGQYRVLDPGIFGTSFSRFKAQYAVTRPVPGKPNAQQVVGFKNKRQLREEMNRLRYHVGEEALDLPEIQIIDRTCELDPDARRHHEELKNVLITEVEQGIVTVKNALSKLLKLQQVAAGFLKMEDGEEQRLGSAKLDLLEEILEDAGPEEPVVVFARFKHDLRRIREVAEKCGRQPGEISGSHRDYGAWQEGRIDTLAVQIQAGSEGIDLTRAHIGVFFTLGYSLGQYRQALARLHRPGQDSKVTVYRLLASRTVDLKIKRALDKRADVVREIIEGIQEKENG